MEYQVGDYVEVMVKRHTAIGRLVEEVENNVYSHWKIEFTAADFPAMAEAYESAGGSDKDKYGRTLVFSDNYFEKAPPPFRVCPQCEQERRDEDFVDYLCKECR